MTPATTDLPTSLAATSPLDRLAASAQDAPLGIYLHVPFCARRCGYCAFTTYAVGTAGDRGAQERFVADALAELVVADRVLGPDRPPLTSVFVGGGTPTVLSDRQFAALLDGVRARFELAAEVEVTVEANPDGLRVGQLAALRDAGATRISFGMQSASRRVLQTLDRTHDPERALAAVGEARAAGFDHVSLDLIYGTPGETAADWSATLQAAAGTAVDHISAYALGVEPGTKLAARVRSGALPDPDADQAADRYLAAEVQLGAAGFEWYEISNWARTPDARCRHNDLYWRSDHWWGIGPGAHSHVGGVRWWNPDGLAEWGDAARSGRAPLAGHEVLTDDERRLEAVMLGIRRSGGLPVELVERRDAVAPLVADGLVTQVDDRLVLTVRGRLLADHVVRRLT